MKKLDFAITQILSALHTLSKAIMFPVRKKVW